MKRHEPAYQFAQARVREMCDVRFIQVNHLHPDNDLHTAEFKVRRFDDIPRSVREESQTRTSGTDRRGAGVRRRRGGSAGDRPRVQPDPGQHDPRHRQPARSVRPARGAC